MATKFALHTTPALLLLGFSLLLLPQTHQLLLPAQASTETIHLAGYYPSGWNSSNPTITVPQGETVTIDLSSGDVAPHQFLLDLDNDGITDVSNCSPNSFPTDDPCSAQFSGTSTASVTFAANSVGSFNYYCTIHCPKMVGTFIVQAPGFSLVSSPSSLGVIQSLASNSSIISLTSLNQFSGTINLTSTVSQPGLTVSFNPVSVMIASGGSGTSLMTVSTSSTPPGFYTVRVDATSSSTTNTTTVDISVTIPDFRISPSPPVLSITQGSSATTKITLTSLSEFKGTLTLTGTISPPGPIVSFSPTSVTLLSGGIVTSNMTVAAAGGTNNPVAPGNYPVTVTATNGTLTHTTIIEITVAPSPSSGTGNLLLTLLVGAAAVVIVVVAATIYLVRRRTGQNRFPSDS